MVDLNQQSMFFEIEGNVSQQPMRLSDLAVKMLKLHHGNTGFKKIMAVQFLMIDRNTPTFYRREFKIICLKTKWLVL